MPVFLSPDSELPPTFKKPRFKAAQKRPRRRRQTSDSGYPVLGS